jgi:hypothetical protein
VATIEIPFATQEGRSVVRQNSQEFLLNMFAEIEVTGRQKLIRRQRPGLKAKQALIGTARAVEQFKGKQYIVSEDRFYTYDGTSLIQRGTLGTTSGRCTIIFNDNEDVLISDGSTGYLWKDGTFKAISAPVQIGTLAYQGGFGIFNVPGTGQFYVTGLNDFSSVDALDFATAESYGDNLVRVFVDHNELWLFGTNSTEVWQLSGSADFPFARFTNAQIERGTVAPFSVGADDNTVFWLGDDKVVYRADGYRPMRVSTHPIERLIAKVGNTALEKADAVFYTLGGHKFYTLNFPGELTVQYNIATGFWNVCRTYGHDDWQVLGSAGHYSDYLLTPTALVELVPGLSTDEGAIMERGGISGPMESNGKRITIRSFLLDAEMGRARINQNANVMLRLARDGETFGNERWRSLGATGEYRRRAMWRNLGVGRKPAVSFMVTDNVEFAIVGAAADIDVADF